MTIFLCTLISFLNFLHTHVIFEQLYIIKRHFYYTSIYTAQSTKTIYYYCGVYHNFLIYVSNTLSLSYFYTQLFLLIAFQFPNFISPSYTIKIVFFFNHLSHISTETNFDSSFDTSTFSITIKTLLVHFCTPFLTK